MDPDAYMALAMDESNVDEWIDDNKELLSKDGKARVFDLQQRLKKNAGVRLFLITPKPNMADWDLRTAFLRGDRQVLCGSSPDSAVIYADPQNSVGAPAFEFPKAGFDVADNSEGRFKQFTTYAKKAAAQFGDAAYIARVGETATVAIFENVAACLLRPEACESGDVLQAEHVRSILTSAASAR